MKKIFVILILFAALSVNAQWQKMFEIYANINQFTSNTNYVFCGTGPTGVFRSSNSGLTWDSVNSGLANKRIWTITAKGNYIFAGTDSGLFRSTNNGENWSSIHQNIYNIFVLHLDCNEQYVFAGTIKGLFRSSNQGITWDSINTGLPYNFGRVNIDALTASNDTLYVGVGTGTYSIPRVYRSYNNGNNWVPIIYSGIDSSTIYSLEVKDSIVLCGTYKGVYISRNSGINWRRIPEINQNIGLFGLSILDNNNILISSFGYGVQVSTNGGANWIFKNEGIIPDEYYACALYSIGGMTYLGTRPFSYLPAIYRRNTSQLIPVVENNIIIPEDIELYQNYPNPFNPTTSIRFSINRKGLAKLSIFNVSGKEIEKLVFENLNAGIYRINWNASKYPSGAYYCRLEMNDKIIKTKKMILLK
jgi:photosystem II stability/assembly factor-like uncharacterized protein